GPEGAGDGDHRRARAHQARAVRGRPRLSRLLGQPRHGDHHPDDGRDPRRAGVRAGGRRHRRRQRPGQGGPGVRQQGGGAARQRARGPAHDGGAPGGGAGVSGYRDLAERAACVVLARDAVRVAGPEAATYLQGQLSQDVEALAPGASAWTLVLQPQGRIDAWGRITRLGEDEFVVDTDGGFGDALAARLARFKLRVKADIEPLDWRCVAVRGPAAEPPSEAGAVVARAEWPLIG